MAVLFVDGNDKYPYPKTSIPKREAKLTAFVVHNDALGMCNYDERKCLLVWDFSPIQAMYVGLIHFNVADISDCDYNHVNQGDLLPEGFFPPDVPGIETRPEVLRRAGFAASLDEHLCTDCLLFPMGMEKYALCPVCEYCKECHPVLPCVQE